MRNIWL